MKTCVLLSTTLGKTYSYVLHKRRLSNENTYCHKPAIYTEMVYKICGKILEDWTLIEYDRRHVCDPLILVDALSSYKKVTLEGRRNRVCEVNGAIDKLN